MFTTPLLGNELKNTYQTRNILSTSYGSVSLSLTIQSLAISLRATRLKIKKFYMVLASR